jgi:hypothetical protein
MGFVLAKHGPVANCAVGEVVFLKGGHVGGFNKSLDLLRE